MAVLAVAAAGAAAGSWIGGTIGAASLGASIGWSVGAFAGNALFGPKQRTVGPRLADLNIQGSSYGDSIPILRGTIRTAGKVIWMGPLYEVPSTRKIGKNATVTEYAYQVSMAIALCDGPISGVRRIWCNKTIIADWSQDPESAAQSLIEAKYAGGAQVYLGTEDQEPDDEMEANEGVGAVPAYRGLAYIRFDRFQLEPFGNQVPNFEFEVVIDGDYGWPVEIANYVTGQFDGQEQGGQGSVFHNYVGATYNSREGWLRRGDAYFFDDSSAPYATGVRIQVTELFDDGTSAVKSDTRYQYPYSIVNPTWMSSLDVNSALYMVANTYNYYIARTVADRWNGTPGNTHNVINVGANGPMVQIAAVTNAQFSFDTVAGFPAGVTWNDLLVNAHFFKFGPAIHCLSSFGGGSNNSAVYWTLSLSSDDPDVPGVGQPTFIADLSDVTFSYGGPAIVVDDRGLWIRTRGDGAKLRRRDNNGAITDWTLPYADNSKLIAVRNDVALYWASVFPGQGIAAARLPDGGGTAEYLGIRYTADFDYALAPISDEEGYALTSYGLFEARYTLTDDPPDLEAVITDLCVKAGISSGNVVATSCSDLVEGYVFQNRGAARSAIEPLLLAYGVDCVESDGKLHFIKRSTAGVSASISGDDLAAGMDAASEKMESTRRQEAELPQLVDVTYLDEGIAYQAATQSRQRGWAASEEKVSVNLPIALSTEQGSAIATRLLFEAWNERTRRTLNLSRKWMQLDPTDVVDVDLDGATYRLRIVSRREEAGLLTLDGVDVDTAIYDLPSAPAQPGDPPPGTTPSAPTEMIVMEIPPLADWDDEVGLYVNAGPSSDGRWMSGAVYRQSPGGAIISAASISGPATWGIATTALGTCDQVGLPDEENSVTVNLRSGTIASITYDELIAGGNLAYLGGEIIAFRDADYDSGTRLWTLSGLLRGLKGTDYATHTHAIGDEFCLLDGGERFVRMQGSDIGQSITWRGVASGQSIEAADTETETLASYTLKPLAPHEFRAVRLGGQTTIRLKWIRRARIDASWRYYVDVPLDEAAESYEVDILDTDGDVVRTITGITSTSTDYTAAQQITDFGFPVLGSFRAEVRQVSATVGRGWPASLDTTIVSNGSYERDWSDNTNAFQTLYGLNITLGAGSGVCTLSATADSHHGKCPFDSSVLPSHGDGYVECDLKINAVDPVYPSFRGAGILFRTTSWSASTRAGFAYGVFLSDDGSIYLYRGTDSVTTTATELGRYAAGVTINTFVTVGVSYYGSTIKVFVNGTERISVTDATFSAGLVGIYGGNPWSANVKGGAVYTHDNFSCEYY